MAKKTRSKARGLRTGERPVVLVLPGIMGSELEDKPGDNHIWIDPIGILLGDFGLLRMAANGVDDADPSVRIEAPDVIDTYYKEIRKKLRKKGFDARHHPFDWRRNIGELAGRLADYIVREVPADQPLSLVAHSMGGLVSRALFALHPETAARVNRLIMLGTPNFGSFSPAQVFSGDDTMVRVVGGLDFVNSTAELTATLASFPGLVAMLPNPAKVPEPNFLSPATWPSTLLPAAALQRTRDLQASLERDVADRTRYTLIAGFGRDTVAAATMTAKGEFRFQDGDGDGTVPLDLCVLPNVNQTYFTQAKHGAMPTDNEVVDAVIDILIRGEARLPKLVLPRRSQRALRPHRSPEVEIPAFVRTAKSRLKSRQAKPSPATRKRAARRLIARLTASQKRELERVTLRAAEAFIAPPTRASKKGAAAADTPPPLPDRLPRRLLIKTALGSVTEARAAALALGVFPAVQPQGSLAALDTAVNGYVTQLFEQGAIHGGLGEVMFLPTPGASMPAEMAVLVGLGEARNFNPSTLERVGENLARGLTQLGVPDIATVAIGSSRHPLVDTLAALFRGFLVGLNATDPDCVFRSITICEADPKRLAQIRAILNGSLEDWRQRGVELELKEIPDLPAPSAPARRYRDLAYWIETLPNGIRFVLMAAAVNPEKTIEVSTAKLAASVTKLQADMESHASDARKAKQQRKFGARLAALMPKPMAAAMKSRSFDHARVELAESAAMVPWELLRVGQSAASLQLPLVRRLGISGDHRPVAEYLLEDARDRAVRLAVVADPTGDLPGARREGIDLVEQLGRNSAFRVSSFIGPEECSERTLFELIDAGAIDVLHYAGHGCFNPEQPETSGLVINGEDDGILTAAEIRRCRRPPLLVFTNACQVGIVPPKAAKSGRTRKTKGDRGLRARQPYGFAESLLRLGVRSYVGTFWSIPDDAAVVFAQQFYSSIGQGAALGEAMFKARSKTRQWGKSGAWAWASYMLYGPAWLRLVGK